MRYRIQYVFLASTLLFAAACNNEDGGKSEDTPSTTGVATPDIINFAIVNKHPHDTAYFVEGFEFYKGQLFESSGSGSSDPAAKPWLHPSAFGVADLKTGKVDTKVSIDNHKYFGEGITFFNDKVYQLTYQTKVGFVYDANTFKKLKEFTIPANEGWGLTHDSTNLIMSDGTSNLYFIQPDSMKLMSIVSVTDNSGPVANINELEYANGFIYANQWLTPYILKIDPVSGRVVGKMDLSSITSEITSKNPDLNELNGIAYNAATGTFFVTGKNWPTIYEVKLQ
ncbi:MAG: glutaminyl-peptide cyclotransferase [Chitinophagaceae bacterium]